MTPQSTQPGTDPRTHLTEDQFGELLDQSPATSAKAADVALAEAHLLTCDQCAVELASLRESLSLFRDASTAYAENQLRSLPSHPIPLSRPVLQPAYWAAAAAILFASFLPLQFLHRHNRPPQAAVTATVQQQPTESDDDLLQSVSSEISESVPTPMQALADPTANGSTSAQNATQRKN
jgi:hypothetical protein